MHVRSVSEAGAGRRPGRARSVGIGLAFVGLLMMPPVGRAQEAGSLLVSGRVTTFPLLNTVGLGAEVHLHPRLALGVSVRGVSSDILCAGTRPAPCGPDGTGVGILARAQSIATRSWWPYAEGTVGMHRYASTNEWKPFFGGNAGFGWYFGRASLRLGVDVGWIGADPPDPGFGVRILDDASYDHLVIGLLAVIGVRLR